MSLSLQEMWVGNAGAFKLAGLFGILLFSFWAGMSPHWDYQYPLHVDEWFAMGYAQSTLGAGGLEYVYPYGGGDVSFHPEMGFHLQLAFLKAVTGLSWMELYQVAPGILLALMAFLTYALGRRHGFGWSAALLVPLIPTSVRTLGPSVVVPLSAAMLFIPVTLMALNVLSREGWGTVLGVLLVLIAGALFVHPTTEAIITIVGVLYLTSFMATALAKRRYHHSAKYALSMVLRGMIPVTILALWLPALTKEVLSSSASGGQSALALMGPHVGFYHAFGVLGLALALMGLGVLVWRRDLG